MVVALRETGASFQPSFPLVEAKLQPHLPSPGAVDRARLVDLLLDADGPAIVSVIAPPGYGKTTLLGQWAARERRPVAWLTIDDLDNDPAMLFSYVAAALDRIHPLDPSLAAGFSGSAGRVVASVVPRLLAELHRWRRPMVLILDDAHRLVDQPALDALAAFLEHLPAGSRAALAGRTEPVLPFARFRAQRSLLALGQSLLALDASETAALAAGAGHPITPEAAQRLADRTEGWAAGIYLATVRRDDGDDRPLADVSGTDRYIAAYLGWEFDSGLEEQDHAFLRRTAILERIEPSLAEAVTGLPDAAARLETLAARNLLIQRVGRSGASYRYHILLREYLAAELQQREPGMAQVLHRRASEWHAAAGNHDLAIQHAVLAADLDAAALIVTRVALPTFYAGHLATLDRWLSRFDDGTFARNPPLAVIGAWISLLTGRPGVAIRLADVAERATFKGVPPDGSASFESARAMLRAVMCRDGPRDALVNARRALAEEVAESPWRANALYLVGAAEALLGDRETADLLLEQAVLVGSSGSGATAMSALAGRASIRITAGDWTAADGFVREGRALLERGHYEGIGASVPIYALGARIAIHRGDLEAGRDDLVRAQLVRPLLNVAMPWFSVGALLELARAYLAISDPAGAQMVLREAEQIVRQRPGLGTLTDELVDLRRQLAGAASTLAGSSTLTTGELRVLPYLPTYLSFQDIADRLSISRNTVKTHAMSIYGKLWASSRGEAVERAVELGLLEPYPALMPDRTFRVIGEGSAQHDEAP